MSHEIDAFAPAARRQAGLTLIQLMIIIGVVGVVAAVVVQLLLKRAGG